MRHRLSATRKTVLLFVGAFVATVVVAALVTGAVRLPREERAEESPFPPYWSELREGETTRKELVARLGEPTDAVDDCLQYERLVEPNYYKFCFEDGTLFQKSAY